MAREIRYASSDGVQIAYEVFGSGPRDLVLVHGWVTNIELLWEQPRVARVLERLGSFCRVVNFDKRGTGLSDRVPVDRLPTLEQRMDDVRAVMDAAGSERAVVFGHSEGGPMSLLFAAAYPQRTEGLVIYGSFAVRLRQPDYPWAPTAEERETPRPARQGRVGRRRAPGRARARGRGRRGVPRLVGQVPALEREPGRRGRPHRHEQQRRRALASCRASPSRP